MSGVADNANDLKRAVFRLFRMINNDVLAKRDSSVEEFLHEGFVHHHDRHPFPAVARIESASGLERNMHRMNVIAHDGEMRRIRMVAGTGIGPAGDPKRGSSIVTRKR